MELGIWFTFHDAKMSSIVVKPSKLDFDYDRMQSTAGDSLTYIRPSEERNKAPNLSADEQKAVRIEVPK
jgi:hypothetical protein